MEERVYKPYHQYISEMDKLDDDAFFNLIKELERICYTKINISKLICDHNNKRNYLGVKNKIDIEKKPEILLTKRLDALIELCSLVNKVTKADEKNKDKIKLTENETNKLIKWELNAKKKKYLEIIENLKSKSEETKKNAIKQYVSLSDEEFKEFKELKELQEDKKYFYRLKRELLTAIIYELRTHPEEYKDYKYGFVKDATEKEDTWGEFAINPPGHLGTYQFHFLRGEEDDIIYNISSIRDVKHEYTELAVTQKEGDQRNVYWIYTSDDIKDLKKVEEKYKEIKSNLKKSVNIEDENYQKLYILAILLKKDPEKELMEINPEAFERYKRKTGKFTEDKEKKSRRLSEQYETIIERLKATGKIYVASLKGIDSKVAIEAIIRQARKEGVNREIEVIEVNPGKQNLSGGVYINVNKDGVQINDRNKVIINSNDSINEQSVCSVLSTLGFDVPRNIVNYASKVMPQINKDPNNAYLLLGRLSGKAIFDFCKEIGENEENLMEISLTEENIGKYSSLTEEDKQTLLEEGKRKAEIFEEVKKYIKYYNIGDKKVAINADGISVGTYGMYLSYAEDADYYIGINNDENNGVQFTIQANPNKGDLPLELERWAYQKLFAENTIKNLDDVLIEKRRIIFGARTKPDISLKDRREDTSKPYIDEIMEEIISEIANIEGENLLAESFIKQSFYKTSMKDIESAALGIINTKEEKDKDGGEIGEQY